MKSNPLVDFTNYTSIQREFYINKSLCNLFKLLAVETWKRLEFIYMKPYIKLYETTITQNIAFTIDSYKDKFSLPIEIYESTDEKANGNDLELIIKFPYYGISFYTPIQAKKIFRNRKYSNIRHGKQIESLITYAEKNEGYPLYLFYNYLDHPLKSLGSNYEIFGCTILDAYTLMDKFYKRVKPDGTTELKWRYTPSFDDLNKLGAFPWHELVCKKEPLQILKIFFPKEIKNIEENYPTTLINIFELAHGMFKELPGVVSEKNISFEGWRKSVEKTIDNQKRNPSIFSKTNTTFNPQTRFAVTLN